MKNFNFKENILQQKVEKRVAEAFLTGSSVVYLLQTKIRESVFLCLNTQL